MSEREATFQEHLGQVSKAKLVAKPPTHDQQDDVGRKLEEVELCACPLIEPPLAGGAPEAAVAEDGLLLER